MRTEAVNPDSAQFQTLRTARLNGSFREANSQPGLSQTVSLPEREEIATIAKNPPFRFLPLVTRNAGADLRPICRQSARGSASLKPVVHVRSPSHAPENPEPGHPRRFQLPQRTAASVMSGPSRDRRQLNAEKAILAVKHPARFIPLTARVGAACVGEACQIETYHNTRMKPILVLRRFRTL